MVNRLCGCLSKCTLRKHTTPHSLLLAGLVEEEEEVAGAVLWPLPAVPDAAAVVVKGRPGLVVLGCEQGLAGVQALVHALGPCQNHAVPGEGWQRQGPPLLTLAPWVCWAQGWAQWGPPRHACLAGCLRVKGAHTPPSHPLTVLTQWRPVCPP